MSIKKQHVLTQKPHILILGGSENAYLLAQKLEQFLKSGNRFSDKNCGRNKELEHFAEPSEAKNALANSTLRITTSLAGRTQNPRLPLGEWRIGGFGGIEGLIQFIKQQQITLIIDATHPFARNIKLNCLAAAAACAVPLLRLNCPAWQKIPGDNWIEVQDEIQAATILPKGDADKRLNVFLALGRLHLQAFASRHDINFVARMLEKTGMETISKEFSHLKIILGLPKMREDERALLQEHNIDFLVCRNSGSKASYGKIAAARDLSIPIIMITHPDEFPSSYQNHNIHNFCDLEMLYDYIINLYRLNFL